MSANRHCRDKPEQAVFGGNIVYAISERDHLGLLSEGTVRVLVGADPDTIKERCRALRDNFVAAEWEQPSIGFTRSSENLQKTDRLYGRSTMKEISEHRIYDLLKGRYSRIGCDYVILESEDEYTGAESHRAAVIRAWEILNQRYSPYDIRFDLDADKMTAVPSSIDELLELPADGVFPEKGRADRSYSIDAPIPYWYAFLEPPHGTPYWKSDFREFNAVLFPNRDGIEVFRWNDDFSDYFDAGKEWWGTGLWSVFDPKTASFVIIGASMTD